MKRLMLTLLMLALISCSTKRLIIPGTLAIQYFEPGKHNYSNQRDTVHVFKNNVHTQI